MITGQDKDEDERIRCEERPSSCRSSGRDALVADDAGWKPREKLIGNGVQKSRDVFNNPLGVSSDDESAEARSIIRRDVENGRTCQADPSVAGINLSLETEDEDDDDYREGIVGTGGWMRKKVVTRRENFNERGDNDGRAVQPTIPSLDETSYGDVSIVNSEHVHVGNTNFYKGPVTIKQFVYTNARPIVEDAIDRGNENARDTRDFRNSDVSRNGGTRVKDEHLILPTYGDYDKVTRWLWTWRCAVILCVIALSSVTVVVVASVILTSKTPLGTTVVVPDSPTSGTNGDVVWVDSVRFIERNKWIAQPPTEPLRNLSQVPVPYVIISHTATEGCNLQSECVLRVRLIQTYHIESYGWSDIGYNFLIGGDGLAYVGRGWDAEGAHAFGWNRKSIGISVIGTFNDVPPYKTQIHAVLKLIEVGVKMGKISPDYKLLGHRQVSNTLSPGDKLYAILQTWDHWSPTPRPSASGRAVRSTPNLILVLLSSILLTLFLEYCRPLAR